MSSSRANKANSHFFFEQLGVPLLIYRETSAYRSEDTIVYPPTPNSVNLAWIQRVRSHARWYYQLDCRTFKDDEQMDPRLVEYMLTEQFENNPLNRQKPRERQLLSFLSNNDYRLSQSIRAQQEYRCHMLRGAFPTTGIEVLGMTLQLYQRFDVPTLPGLATDNNNIEGRFTAPAEIRDALRRVSFQRRFGADPAYLAPFGTAAVQAALEESEEMANSSDNKEDEKPPGRTGRKHVARNKDFEGNPGPLASIGNCMISFVCPCKACRKEGAQPTHCLLHPVGPLLETLCLSHIQLPHGTKLAQRGVDSAKVASFELQRLLPLHCRVCQILQVSTESFMVRTEKKVVMVGIDHDDPRGYIVDKDKKNVKYCHGSRIHLRVLHEFGIDPEWRPRHVALHPKYGHFSPLKMAIVCEHLDDYFVILYAGSVERGFQRKLLRVPNLDEIGAIEYSSHSPHVLWAVATSYVRPVPTSTPASAAPQFGHGRSLYTIDIQTDLATFEWSPSASLFQVEGVHSLTGLDVNWEHDSVILASATAGIVWELSLHRPCQVRNSWSLSSDEHQIPKLAKEHTVLVTSCVSVGVDNPGISPILTFRNDGTTVSICQRPTRRPHLMTDPLEAPSCPGISHANLSVATTSQIVLSDAPIIGISSSLVNINHIMADAAIHANGFLREHLRHACLIYSLTNRGDVYAHIMMASLSTKKLGKALAALPAGMSVIPVTDDRPLKHASVVVEYEYVRNVNPANQLVVSGEEIISPFALSTSARSKTRKRKSEGVFDESTGADPESDHQSFVNSATILEAVSRTEIPSGIQANEAGGHLLESGMDCFEFIDMPTTGSVSRSDVGPTLLSSLVNEWENTCSHAGSDDDD